MEKFKISEKEKKLFKVFLTPEELDDVALQTNTGVSTVYNIISGRQYVNKKTTRVYEALNVSLFKSLCRYLPIINAEINMLSEKTEIKNYVNQISVNL